MRRRLRRAAEHRGAEHVSVGRSAANLAIGITVVAYLAACTATQSTSAEDATPVASASSQVSPDLLREPAGERGRVERLDYSAQHDGQVIQKHALVYLPAGYDTDTSARFDILYLMHGAGMDADSWLGGAGRSTPFSNLLDHMTESGRVKPTIVVTPTFYPDGNLSMDLHYDGELDRAFHDELDGDLIPVVETRFRTYATSVDAAGLTASRDHRAFGGFSMGAVTTWYTFINELDYFRFFLPMAGDCWVIQDTGGAAAPQRTAQYLADVAARSGYDKDAYLIVASVGSADGTMSWMQPQIQEMLAFPERFDARNLRFLIDPGGGHTMDSLYNQFYRSAELLF